jgi:hypothetical protein
MENRINERVVNEFNLNTPIGTKVSVVRDDGSTFNTETRSAAWVLGGTPVIMVKGISGGYDLGRVTKL